jgi:hypothetical protein
MRFKEDRPFATPEAAERKLLELANVIEADHAERLSVAVINKKFRGAGGSYEEIPHGGDHRNCARLAHDASVRRLSDVHAGRGRPVRVVNVRFGAHCRLKSDIVLGPKRAANFRPADQLNRFTQWSSDLT